MILLGSSQPSTKALEGSSGSPAIASATQSFPLIAQATPTAPTPTAPTPSSGSPWWWLIPAAGSAGVLAWWLARRSATNPSSPKESLVSADALTTSPSTALESGLKAAPSSIAEPPVLADSFSPALAETVDQLAARAAASLASTEDQSAIEAAKFNVVGHPVDRNLDLSTLDDGLPPLPDGYSPSRIILMPRDPQWAYAYWDVANSHKEDLRRQGGERLALRLFDVTDIDLSQQAPHGMQQFDCDELARQWYLSIPISDRDYQVEIGYLTGDGRWLVLARSNTVRIPPVYPSDWNEDHFMTINWEENLRGKTLMTLVKPRSKGYGVGLHEQLYNLSQPAEWERIGGSMFGSMHHVPASMAPGQVVSSYVFPSGVGMAALPTLSGAIPTLSGVGLNVSGLTMSGVGLAASMPPLRPRKFWLVADAELIVYGATEPDATVTLQGQPIQLSPEGTFRFQTTFPDGHLEYPIMAVAVDGEQNRSIHMTFDRQTPDRRTNTREEAQEEWPQGS
ncbi:MAG: DUF4912 domain-containing protein [Nodosilinea sp. LVE1205-7]